MSNPSTVNFGGTVVNTPSPAENVTTTNSGPTPVTLRPEVVGDGFSLLDGSDITLAPGETARVPVTFTPAEERVQTGNLRLVDVRDGLVVNP